MSAALLFPGQGSECAGMGAALLADGGLLRALLARASRLVDADVIDAVHRGGRLLAKTEVAQPALLAVGVAVAQALKEAGRTFHVVAGHSVGELAALCVAGALTPEDALDVAVTRGRMMGDAAAEAPGAMAALRVSSESEVLEVIRRTASIGPLDVAGHNGPEEWVVSGGRKAIAEAARHAPAVTLPVAGPWHSAAMAPARIRFRAFLDQVPFRPLQLPLVANHDGRFVTPDGDLRELLAAQLVRPVRWATTLQTLAQAGVDSFHIAGPGRILRGLCRANLGASVHVELQEGASLSPGSPP